MRLEKLMQTKIEELRQYARLCQAEYQVTKDKYLIEVIEQTEDNIFMLQQDLEEVQ
jgi:ketopantoate reductase